MTADCGLDLHWALSQHTEGNQIEFLRVKFTIEFYGLRSFLRKFYFRTLTLLHNAHINKYCVYSVDFYGFWFLNDVSDIALQRNLILRCGEINGSKVFVDNVVIEEGEAWRQRGVDGAAPGILGNPSMSMRPIITKKMSPATSKLEKFTALRDQ